MIGQIIGSYKIEEKLGEGGMGTVYRGVDMMLEREVAIKALRPELGGNPQIVERFRSEAVTLAKLIHQNVVTLYSFMRHGSDYFMVLEFVRGETLDSIIQREGRIPVERAIPMFGKMLDGIEYAHEFGIVHRDIKPANMILSEKGALKVLDFGIARILGTARMTKAGNVIGTIEYMSPEQVKGQETDARSDIYSLGMLLYEMLTGRVPFESQNEFELMSAQVNQAPTPPRELNPDIPEEVEQAILRAVAKNPDERFQHAAEFRAALMAAGIGTASDATTGSFNAYATTRLSNPAISSPGTHPGAVSQPGAASPVTMPMAASPASQADGPKETRIGTAPVVAPPASGAPKETRMGTPAAVAGGPKETRIGAPAAYAPQQPQQQPAQPSFFSKLKPVHYVGASVAALVLVGLLVGVPLALLMSGSKKAAAPAAEKIEQPAQPVAPAPVQEQATAPAAPPTVAGEQTAPAPVEATSLPEQKPLDLSNIRIDDGTASSGQTKAASKPAAKAPPTKPRGDSAAEAARRRRDAALRALDQ